MTGKGRGCTLSGVPEEERVENDNVENVEVMMTNTILLRRMMTRMVCCGKESGGP